MSWPWERKAAVDERFYADQHTTFTVTRSDTWRGPGFNVANFSGGPAVMQAQTVDEVGNGVIRSFVLVDAASHGQIVAVEESWLGISGHRQWEAFRGQRGTTGTADRLFVAVEKTRFFQMGSQVHVFLDGNSSGGLVPDFVVHGSGTMTVSRGGDGGGHFVAQIRKESSSLWSWLVEGDSTYTVWIHRGVDQAFVLALALILDPMLAAGYYDKKRCNHQCKPRNVARN